MGNLEMDSWQNQMPYSVIYSLGNYYSYKILKIMVLHLVPVIYQYVAI